MKRTGEQNRRFWALINKLGIDEETRKSMILQYTGGRTEHSSEMTAAEMGELLEALESQVEKLGKEQERAKRKMRELKQRKRRTVFRLFYRLGWIEPQWPNDRKLRVINDWLWRRAGLEKHLNELEVKELNKVIRQLNIVIENYESGQADQGGETPDDDIVNPFAGELRGMDAREFAAMINKAEVKQVGVNKRTQIRIGYKVYIDGYKLIVLN